MPHNLRFLTLTPSQLREQAERCRRLVKDGYLTARDAEILLILAQEYEALIPNCANQETGDNV